MHTVILQRFGLFQVRADQELTILSVCFGPGWPRVIESGCVHERACKTSHLICNALSCQPHSPQRPANNFGGRCGSSLWLQHARSHSKSSDKVGMTHMQPGYASYASIRLYSRAETCKLPFLGLPVVSTGEPSIRLSFALFFSG